MTKTSIERILEELRGQNRFQALNDKEIARRACIGSHATLKRLRDSEPNLTLRVLRQLIGIHPVNRPMRAIETAGKFSKSRKIIMQAEAMLDFDPLLLQSTGAAYSYGSPIEDEMTAYHVIDPFETDLADSTFRRWQVVEGVEGGTDFTGSTIRDVPDPVIRDEFLADLAAVYGTLQPQFTLIHRYRKPVLSGDITDRLFSRVILPRERSRGGLEIVVIRRMQEFGSAQSLFPQLFFDAPG